MTKTIKLLIVAGGITSSAHAEEWVQSFDLGATISKGNSESALVTAGYSGTKVEEYDEYGIFGSYTYGKESGNKTNDEYLGSAYWNRLLSERMYAGVRGDLRLDSIADIDYRVSVSGVLGYYFVKTADTYLAFEAGPGYTTEQVGGDSDDYLSVYVGQKFEHKFSEKTRVFQSLGMVAPAKEMENYSLVAEAGVETFLSDALSLRVLIQNRYETTPAAGSDNNDFKLITGVSYKF